MAYPNYPQYQQYLNPYQQYPQTYPQQPLQPIQQVQQTPTQIAQLTPQQQSINQGLLWVQGEAGAKSYLVAPNTTVLLMDSEGSRFFLKSTDNAGMPSLRTFEYTEVVQNAPQAPQSDQNNLDDKYVTREEYDGLKRQYEDILNRLDNMPTARNTVELNKETTNNNKRNKGGNDNG